MKAISLLEALIEELSSRDDQDPCTPSAFFGDLETDIARPSGFFSRTPVRPSLLRQLLRHIVKRFWFYVSLFTVLVPATCTALYSILRHEPALAAVLESGSANTIRLSNTISTGYTPTLVDHVNTASNCYAYDTPTSGYSHPGNPFYILKPNPAFAGNCLILNVTCPYSSSRTATVIDDKGNTWTLAKAINNGTTMSSVYVALNVIAGTRQVTVTFDTPLLNCHFSISEFYNVATASALDGAAAATLSGTKAIAAGSFRPSTSGDLIYMYGYDTSNSTGITGAVTNMTPGSGFTFLSADIMIGTFSEYMVQTSAATINPTVTTSGGMDHFNAIAIALKSAKQGTAPPATGIRIVHIQHVFYNRPIPILFPSVGNLLFVATAFDNTLVKITSVTSNPHNTWVELDQSPVSGNYPPQCFYAQDATTANSLLIKANGVGRGPHAVSFVMYDIVGAAVDAYDTQVSQAALNVPSGNFNFLTIIPSTANGLVLAVMSDWYGYVTGMTVANQMFDTVTYVGEDNQYGADWMDNCDGYVHYYNPDTSPITFGWTLDTSIISKVEHGVAIAFKAASPSSSPGLSYKLP